MTDKVQKIREKVERLKSQLLRVLVLPKFAMETRCKEEEPVSKQKLSNVERTVKDWKEEPVSEDLKECKSKVILEGANFDKSWYSHPELAFMAGAKQQESKDKEIIETAIHQAYHNGRLEMEEQMMMNAIEGKIYETQARSKLKATTTGYLSCLDYRAGDKVKVIVIKEE